MLLFSLLFAAETRCQPSSQRRLLTPLAGPALGLLSLLSLPALPARAQNPANPIIQVGVVQRFGDEPTETLVLEPLPGDQLTLEFVTQGQPQSVKTSQVTLSVAPQALPAPELRERVVLSNHRSFESAEDSARQWRDRGIEVEIAQPTAWEVWAKREIYSTPLLRRLLLKNLQAQGISGPYLDSQVVAAVPKAAFTANGFRYSRDQVNISSANQRVRVIEDGNLGDAKLYGGKLRLQPNTYGTYTLVNDVPVETYLRGVVPHEIGLGAPPAAIEAQAILARTYVLRNLRRFAIDNYQICADTQCQVYWGLGGAAARSDQAIANTQGLVLTYQNELVDALYSSTTGGVTAAFSHVWNGPDRPYLQPVVDSVQGSWNLAQQPLNSEPNVRAFLALSEGFNETEWDMFRWQYDSPLAEIAQDIRTYLQRQQDPKAAFSQILNVSVTERATSGRVQTLAVQTDLGTVTLAKDEIVRVMSAPRSLLFYVEPLFQPPTAPPAGAASSPTASQPVLKGFRFVGGGRGHGVGLSQTGAYHLGDLGYSGAQIVQFYFPGTVLQPFSPSLVLWRDPAAAAAAPPPPLGP